MLDTRFGDEVEEGRLFKLYRQPLAKRPVKHGIAGGINEVGRHQRVFLSEYRRPVERKRECYGSHGNQEAHDRSSPCPTLAPRPGFRDLHLRPGVVRSKFGRDASTNSLELVIYDAGGGTIRCPRT